MRHALLLCALATLATLASASGAAAQSPPPEVQIRATHVAGTVWMLEGRGGNIGVSVGEDGIVIVDDQYAPMAERIQASLAEIGRGKLRFVLNTHWHTDHTQGNLFFGALAPILAHTNVRKRMAVPQDVRGSVVEASPAGALPIVTYDSGVSLHLNGEEIRVEHYPTSHTDGDSIMWFTGSNVVHLGDLFWTDQFPFVDVDSGGSVPGLIDSIERIRAVLPEGSKIIPGHGRLATAEDLERYHAMLVATTGVVRRAIADGKSLDQIVEAGLGPEWADWGKSYIKTEDWLGFIHRSLTER